MRQINYIITLVLCLAVGLLNIGIIKIFKLKIERLPFKKRADFTNAAMIISASALFTGLVFMALEIIVSRFTVPESKGFGLVFASALVTALEQLFLTIYAVKGKSSSRPFRKIFFSAVILVLCEIFIFNLKSFSTNPEITPLDLNTVNILNDTAEFDGEKIIINGDATLSVENPPMIKGIVVNYSREINSNSRPFEVAVAMKDAVAVNNFETVQNKMYMGESGTSSFSLKPYKEIYTLELRYKVSNNPVEISEISFCNALPFAFSWIRFALLLAVCTALILIRAWGLHRTTYNSAKISHRILVQAVALLCTLSAFLYLHNGDLVLDYNPALPNTADPFSMTLDAFEKGQVYLDLNPEEALNDLNNVYDRSERDASGIFYFWDLALFEGHYYCYFGVAPVLTFYYPFYLISGNVPALPLAMFFFGALAIMFFCQLLIKTVQHFVKKPNLLLLLAFMPVATSCIGVYYCMNVPSMYTLPVVTALCYTFLCLWTGICACTAEKKIFRFLLFFVSGLSLAFAVMARPTLALSALVIAPLYLEVLLNKKYSVGYRVAQAATFLIPVFAGAAFILWYNNARFGSYFDFGQTYQLTVSDIHANTVTLSGFFPMLYHYFMQLPRARSVFPFFEPAFNVLNNYGRYTYLENCLGALSYPLIIAGFLAVPHSCRKTDEKGSIYLTRKYFVLLCFAMALIIGWQDFCMGGAITRYVVDILPLLVIGSAVALMYYTRPENNSSAKMKLILLAMGVSFGISWLINISTNDGTIMRRCPELYDTVENLIAFWR